MAQERVERRLAAILAADVVGYSRLVGIDEEGTIARLKSLREQLIEPTIALHHGRIVKTMGDGILVEFSSVVDAVRCGVVVQSALADRNADLPEERRIRYRIGINLGDIVIDGDDILGDGVNVAARLERIAEPGSMSISGAVFDQINGKVDLHFKDIGPQTVKNISAPVRTYRLTIGGWPSGEPVSSLDAQAILKRPAIAVLPFVNMSRDPDQEYFTDGLTEDIITALSLWRSFPVVARNSTFTYKDKAVKVQEVAKDLDARYLLEGSVRKGGSRLRITAQLIDAETGYHLWAHSYDENLADVFTLQDEITQRIVATIEPELERAEQRRSTAKPPTNLDAWDHFQRGMSELYKFTKDGNAKAREFFERALELQPNYAQANAGIAYSYHRDYFLEFAESREDAAANALEHAQRAVRMDAEDSMSHVLLDLARLWMGQHSQAIAEEERALELNPSNAIAYVTLGNALDGAGRPDEGIPFIEKGLRLNPLDPRNHIYMNLLALAHFNAHRYNSAIDWARRSIQYRAAQPDGYCYLAASLAQIGRLHEAREALSKAEGLQPGFLHNRAKWRFYDRDSDHRHWLEALGKAGLPMA